VSPPQPSPTRHPSLFEPTTLIFGIGLAVLGVIIGLELLTRVGITPNSSLIAAIVTIAASRIPLAVMRPFANVQRQNLMQTVISGATFGGANAILLPLGVLWLLGRPDLVPVMMIGALLALVIDATLLYRLFDSRVFPATGTWPAGVATAEGLIAGDRGGTRARLLLAGGATGGLGQWLGIPMDVFGVCWIGNVWALTMFALGLLARAYAPTFGVDLNAVYAPHGVMIGAGTVALIQIIGVIRKPADPGGATASGPGGPRLGRTLVGGFGAGLWSGLSPLWLLGFVVFAAVAALVSELIVGISAMHAGWFPAFATALIFLVLGMLIGFPPVPLAFLVGFTAATGPAFADMAYDLKAGWILRGEGADPELEREGRRQQYRAELLGFAVAAVIIVFVYPRYFANDLLPPVDRVYVATIEAGADPAVAGQLLRWAVPGAILQFAGGPARQLGILFATGLLILNPAAGWTALAALAIRVGLLKRYGDRAQGPMHIAAGGFIAGSALTSFGSGVVRAR
jgi:uncharacterized oligopeptide transporter (OPT) family protein